jgi:hypothetical protein
VGMIEADIELSNPSKPKLKPLRVRAMEDMDLVISPSRGTITVNPKSPNIPSAIVK